MKTPMAIRRLVSRAAYGLSFLSLLLTQARMWFSTFRFAVDWRDWALSAWRTERGWVLEVGPFMLVKEYAP